MNKSKRKLLIFSLIALFVVISAVPVVAIVFAATETSATINKDLTLSWTATRDVYATVNYKINDTAAASAITVDGSSVTGTLELGTPVFDVAGKYCIEFTIENRQPNTDNNNLTVKLDCTASTTPTNVDIEKQYQKDDGSWETLSDADGYEITNSTANTSADEKTRKVVIRITLSVHDLSKDASFSGNITLSLRGEATA